MPLGCRPQTRCRRTHGPVPRGCNQAPRDRPANPGALRRPTHVRRNHKRTASSVHRRRSRKDPRRYHPVPRATTPKADRRLLIEFRGRRLQSAFRPPELLRNLDFGIAAGSRRIHRRHNFCGVQSNTRPLRSAQHHNRYSAASKILLVSDVLVGGKKTSNPARSASVSKSPLESVSHPRSLALTTVWSIRYGTSGAATLWSKRMSISGRRAYWLRGNRCCKTASGELQNLDHLLFGDVEPLCDLIYGRASFQVFEHGGYGKAGIAKHPRSAQSSRYTFNGGALGPI